MRFSTLATLLGASAAAVVALPAGETDNISSLKIRYEQGTIKNASFRLVEPNVECADADGSQLAKGSVVTCGETDYRFGLSGTPQNGSSTIKVMVYKQTGEASGISGSVETQPYCHVGDNGVTQCTAWLDYPVNLKW